MTARVVTLAALLALGLLTLPACTYDGYGYPRYPTRYPNQRHDPYGHPYPRRGPVQHHHHYHTTQRQPAPPTRQPPTQPEPPAPPPSTPPVVASNTPGSSPTPDTRNHTRVNRQGSGDEGFSRVRR